MNINYLSRKFILSVIMAVIATWYLIAKFIPDTQWLWTMMATVVPFITAHTIQKATGGGYRKTVNIISFWERIKALFDTMFTVALATILLASGLLYVGLIANTVWFPIFCAIGAAYNIGNSIGKLK